MGGVHCGYHPCRGGQQGPCTAELVRLVASPVDRPFTALPVCPWSQVSSLEGLEESEWLCISKLLVPLEMDLDGRRTFFSQADGHLFRQRLYAQVRRKGENTLWIGGYRPGCAQRSTMPPHA